MKCNAKTRSGGKCQKPAMANGKCSLHGGKSKKGIESGTWKHGLYSKYAGESLKKVLAELNEISPDELINSENEIRLMQALIISASALKEDHPELKDLDTLSKVIDRLVSAKQRSMMIQVEKQKLIPASDIERFLDFVEDKLFERFGADGTDIVDQFKNFRLQPH